jgi:hypothetical protein
MPSHVEWHFFAAGNRAKIYSMDNFSPTTAPPPPPEVKVRTMRSDLESMLKNGGGLPQFQNVKVSGTSGSVKTAPSIAVQMQAQTQVKDSGSTQKKNAIVSILITIVFVATLAAVSLFVYMKFFKAAPIAPTQPAAQVPTATAVAPTSSPSNSATVPIMVLPSTPAALPASSAP